MSTYIYRISPHLMNFPVDKKFFRAASNSQLSTESSLAKTIQIFSINYLLKSRDQQPKTWSVQEKPRKEQTHPVLCYRPQNPVFHLRKTVETDAEMTENNEILYFYLPVTRTHAINDIKTALCSNQ